MGTLYRNGIPYVGSGGAGGVEVTQAEYDALPTSEKMNGSIYFITDGSVSYPTASQMRYDNTESGIPSNSVQGAIDELKIEIGDTDISSIGDGSLSGAVSELNAGLMLSASVVYCNNNWQNVHTVNMPAGAYYVIIMNEASLYTGISWGTGAFAFTPIVTGTITSASGNDYTVTINTSNRGACVVMFPLNN